MEWPIPEDSLNETPSLLIKKMIQRALDIIQILASPDKCVAFLSDS